MTSSPLLVMLVTAAIVLATLSNALPRCFLRHRYETELKMSNDDNDGSSSSSSSTNFTSLYITNLDPQVSQELLILMFSDFGKITRSNLATDFRGESRGFAFIDYENPISAKQAMIHMNGRLIGQKILYVERTPKVEVGG